MNGVTLEKATLYEQHRLPYPSLMADELLAQIGPVHTLVDIGAGTGQLARLFAEKSSKVYAIEPDPAMRQVATDSFSSFPSVEVRPGFAEQTMLPDGIADLIVIGNAFHRFKPEACLELRRILKPTGWVALISYGFTNRTFNDLLFSKLAALKNLTTRIENAVHNPSAKDLFGEAKLFARVYPQSHRQNWTVFFGSACSGIEAPNPTDPEFPQFEAINRGAFDALAVNNEIQIDYETRILFGQPLSQ